MAAGRYVRITVTGLPAGDWASFDEFRVFGTLVTLPAAPAGLQAFGGYGLATLSWTASAGATSYNVKRSLSSGTETTIASPTTTNYIDKGLANGPTYYYMVSALNILREGGNSSEVNATPVLPVPGSYESAIVAVRGVKRGSITQLNT